MFMEERQAHSQIKTDIVLQESDKVHMMCESSETGVQGHYNPGEEPPSHKPYLMISCELKMYDGSSDHIIFEAFTFNEYMEVVEDLKDQVLNDNTVTI
jgi:hypothetical protein